MWKPDQQRWALAGPPRAGSTEPPEASFLSGLQVRPSPLETPAAGGQHHPAAGRPRLELAWACATAHGKRQNWLPAGAPPLILQAGFLNGWGRAGGAPPGQTLPQAQVSVSLRSHRGTGLSGLTSPGEVQPVHQADLGGDSVNWRNACERAGSPLSPHTTRPHVFLTLPPCTPVLATLHVSSLANHPRSPGHIPCRWGNRFRGLGAV